LHTTALAGCAATPDNSYTAGVICAKVARYAERIHHPDRLLKPLIRSGAKGEGQWKEASFEAALDLIAEKFEQAEAKFGSETVWLNYYAGTMGLVQRDGIHRLRHAKRYSNQFDSFCTNMAWTGFAMGAGAMRGSDPREMAKSDCVVIWGTNAVSTQVNVMTHAIRARKERGAKIVVIDIYDTPTMKQADIKVLLKPGTDGAFACAVMHVLFREGLADRDYLNKFSDDPAGLESHLKDRTPRMGGSHLRRAGGRDRGLCAAGRHHETDLLPARLRFHPAAQRRGQHACGAVARGLHRQLPV
jgi:anaerobic selenocysteine-containing dehydrogenase